MTRVGSKGSTTIVIRGTSYDAAALPAFIAGERQGLATFLITDEAELITLDAVVPGQGIGTALIAALVQRLQPRVRQLRVTTTNDNLSALRFYQKRGFRIAGVRCGAVDDARCLKPSIPKLGHHGIPIRDEIDLCLHLDDFAQAPRAR
jgi:GNAT superfamily N-acetyltransferase